MVAELSQRYVLLLTLYHQKQGTKAPSFKVDLTNFTPSAILCDINRDKWVLIGRNREPVRDLFALSRYCSLTTLIRTRKEPTASGHSLRLVKRFKWFNYSRSTYVKILTAVSMYVCL